MFSMSENYKDRVRKAIEKNHQKALPKKKKKWTDREGPVVIEIKNALEKVGFSIHRVEARAVWNPDAGRYMDGQTEASFPDLCGCGPDGESVWVEVKAKGKRFATSYGQFEFLKEKIIKGCFAIVADQPDFALKNFLRWKNHPTPKKFLLSLLPNVSPPGDSDDSPIFSDDD